MGMCSDIMSKETDTMGTYRDTAGKETLWVHTGA